MGGLEAVADSLGEGAMPPPTSPVKIGQDKGGPWWCPCRFRVCWALYHVPGSASVNLPTFSCEVEKRTIFTARKRSLGQCNMFTPVCHSGPGGCLIPEGCLILGGVPGPGGGCLVPANGWWRPPPEGYCCGRYASYWNAFLFLFYWNNLIHVVGNLNSGRNSCIILLIVNAHESAMGQTFSTTPGYEILWFQCTSLAKSC